MATTVNHHEMLQTVSRTFALSIEQLPAVLRESVTVAYLLFRIADCLEDHPTLTRACKAELLRLWAQIVTNTCPVKRLTEKISNLDEQDPEVYVAMHADVIIQHMQNLPHELQAILSSHVHETSLGMARWQEHGPFVRDEAEMDDYMHQVAGRVGYLLTEVFSWYSPSIRALKEQLMPLGREFGLALQTVNIIRGMRKDYERGWVFVPMTFYNRLGLSREGLFDPADRDKALQVIDMLADKAERHLQNGLHYITMLPRRQFNIRLFCIWPLLFAVRTLAVSRNNRSVLSAEAKISRAQIKKIVFVSKLFCWSNVWLKNYYRALAKPEPA